LPATERSNEGSCPAGDAGALERDRRVPLHVEYLIAQHRLLDFRHVVCRFALAGDAHRGGVEFQTHIRARERVGIEMDDAARERRLHFMRVSGEAEGAGLADVNQRAAVFRVDGEGAWPGRAHAD